MEIFRQLKMKILFPAALLDRLQLTYTYYEILMNKIYLVLTFLICTKEKSNCLDRDSLEPFKTSLKSAMVETGLQNCVINCKCAPDLTIKCEIMANFNTV